ncbi:MAG: desulfoferrodoxin, partial [Oscillospiraceae bacterium]
MSEKRFYICEICGNMIEMVKSSGVPVVCCGKPMKELVPNTVEASLEKHIPVVEING